MEYSGASWWTEFLNQSLLYGLFSELCLREKDMESEKDLKSTKFWLPQDDQLWYHSA